MNLLRTEIIKNAFSLDLRERFDALSDIDGEDVEDHWNKLKTSYIETCQKVLGTKKRDHKEWISQKSLILIEERRQKKSKVNTSRTRRTKQEAMEEYSKIHKEVKKSVIADKEAFLAEIAEKAERAATVGHQGTLYQMTKILVGKRSKADIPVKSRDGRTISDQEEQVKRWAEYFQELLNRPQPDNPPEILPARRDLPITCDPPSRE